MRTQRPRDEGFHSKSSYRAWAREYVPSDSMSRMTRTIVSVTACAARNSILRAASFLASLRWKADSRAMMSWLGMVLSSDRIKRFSSRTPLSLLSGELGKTVVAVCLQHRRLPVDDRFQSSQQGQKRVTRFMWNEGAVAEICGRSCHVPPRLGRVRRGVRNRGMGTFDRLRDPDSPLRWRSGWRVARPSSSGRRRRNSCRRTARRFFGSIDSTKFVKRTASNFV